MTPPLLRRHEGRLHAGGYKTNYVGKRLRTLRAVVRRAKDDGVPGASAAVDTVSAVKVQAERV